MFSSTGRNAGINAQVVRCPAYSRTWNRLLMAAIAPRLHPVRCAMSNKDMSVEASRFTILRISESCKAHPCFATNSLLLPGFFLRSWAGTILRSSDVLMNGTQVWDIKFWSLEREPTSNFRGRNSSLQPLR